MLKLEKISKYYKYGKKSKKKVLDEVSIDFKKGELVFISGMSGSGKSTLLNIIAGNLKSDFGKIYLDGECINDKPDSFFDYYRNQLVGYIYQDYNLIEYMSVYDNIKIGYTKNDNVNIDSLLKQLDIYDKRREKVFRLSGGEKQRVAIARALVNDPCIILCDEPTGALDSENGIKIMEILKRISRTRLVIVVSHDKELALKYADRVINIKDGKVDNGLLNCNELIVDKNINKIRRFGNFILKKLALKHLWLKKGQTIMTILATSLSFISIMLVLNIANNFNDELKKLEKDVVSIFPITIKNGNYVNDSYDRINNKLDKIYIDNKSIYSNYIDCNYLNFLNNIKLDMSIINYYNEYLDFISDSDKLINSSFMRGIPSDKYIIDNYDFLYGRNVINKNELLLKIDKNNMVSKEILNYFSINDDLLYEDIIGRKIKLVNKNIESGFNEFDSVELEIVGIIREKEENLGGSFLYYDSSIFYEILPVDSKIVPNEVEIYVSSVDDKKILISKLDEYNDNNKKVIYEDVMSDNIKVVEEFINIVSVVLIIFSIVSVVVSLFMIGILTSVRIIERKKEIGIIRSLGASKKNIKKIFDEENIFIGLFSSLLGLLVFILISNVLNSIIMDVIGIGDLLSINLRVTILIVISNILIIKISGSIFSRKASRMEITNCLYNN